MSASPPGASWQRPDLVDSFLDQRQQLLPLIDVQEDLVRRLFERHPHEVGRFLDVGCGDGASSALMLSTVPAAEAVLVDFSEPMLARAERRLGASAGRWTAVRGDLSGPAWRAALPGGLYGAAISSFAIHHLPAERKRELFAELFELLEPGAMFVNMDVVTISGPLAGLFEEQMAANAVEAEHRHAGSRTDEQVAGELLDDRDDDRPDSACSQLQWLREAGFIDVELHFKWAEGAIFGAVRPG
ncbi:MAG: class I SAM-dependent methyltransferase [Solirubrobacteraceae bacterium]